MKIEQNLENSLNQTAAAPGLAFLLPNATGAGQLATHEVTVCTICNVRNTLFVDGTAGDDAAGNGSPKLPFASLDAALKAARDLQYRQVYIATGPDS